MKCPFCGEEMQPGKLRTRGYNYFVPNGCKTPSLYTKKSMEKAGAIPVSPMRRCSLRSKLEHCFFMSEVPEVYC